MANPSLYQIQSIIANEQGNDIIEALKLAFGKDLQTQLSILQVLIQSIDSYYTNIGQPRIEDHFFVGMPIAEDINTLQEQMRLDINLLFKEHFTITHTLDELFALHNVENDYLIALHTKIENDVTIYSTPKSSAGSMIKFFVGDDFNDDSRVDKAESTGVIENGGAMLAKQGFSDYTDEVVLAVDNSVVDLALNPSVKPMLEAGPPKGSITFRSNGFPGNTHEVNTTVSKDSGSFSSNISFVGEEDLHNNILNIIDKDPTTWYEYEVVNVKPSLKADPAMCYGFSFTLGDEGSTKYIHWDDFTDSHLGSIVFDPQQVNPPDIHKSAPENIFTQSIQDRRLIQDTNISDVSSNIIPSMPLANAPKNQCVPGAPQTGKPLRLGIKVVLQQERILNRISILPKIINGRAPRIISIQVAPDPETAKFAGTTWEWRTVTRESSFNPTLIDLNENITPETTEQDTIIFEPRPVRYIRILLEQPQSYPTRIGHIYWIQRDTTVTTKVKTGLF